LDPYSLDANARGARVDLLVLVLHSSPKLILGVFTSLHLCRPPHLMTDNVIFSELFEHNFADQASCHIEHAVRAQGSTVFNDTRYHRTHVLRNVIANIAHDERYNELAVTRQTCLRGAV
jgi:hypothetical protein